MGVKVATERLRCQCDFWLLGEFAFVVGSN
jgi:hypothetical protein